MSPEGTALLVIDMLNPYDHEDANLLIPSVETTVEPIKELVADACDAGVEVIYVNDNNSDWNSSEEELAKQALDGERPDLVEPILPPDGASFVIKARHTAFYGTPLEYLLGEKDIDRLVMTGQVTEQCILYSALDAYVRRLQVCVPRDAVAHIHEDLAEAAITMMERNMGAEVCKAQEVTWSK